MINTTKYFTIMEFDEWQNSEIEKETAEYEKHRDSLRESVNSADYHRANKSYSESLISHIYNLSLADLWQYSQLKKWANRKTGQTV